jgi:hypothetical protein
MTIVMALKKKEDRADDKGTYPNDNNITGATISRINHSPVATDIMDETSIRNVNNKTNV